MSLDGQKKGAGFIDCLEEKYAVKADRFEIVLPLGDVLKFRQPKDRSELMDLRRRSVAWAADVVKSKGCPASWKEMLPRDESTAIYVYWLAALSEGVTVVSGEGAGRTEQEAPKLEHLHLLQMARRMPVLFDAICEALDGRLSTVVAVREIQAVEAAKKDSAPTRSPAAGSRSRPKRGGDTPTS